MREETFLGFIVGTMFILTVIMLVMIGFNYNKKCLQKDQGYQYYMKKLEENK